MQFRVMKASELRNETLKEITTLEELLEFQKQSGFDLVIGPDGLGYRIIIYDDYLD